MKLNTEDHPKLQALRARLGLKNQYEVVGLCELLWLKTAKFAPAGDIGRMTDAQIARMIDWPLERTAELIDALVEEKLLERCAEHRLVVHDWSDHAPDFIKLRMERAEKRGKPGFAVITPILSDSVRQCPTVSESVPPASCSDPICLAKPSQAKPRSPLPPKGEYPDAFERFWKAFPSGRKVSKAKAYRAWRTHVRDPERVIAAASEYAVSPKGQSQFVSGPTPWLNGECWDDDRTAWLKGDDPPNGQLRIVPARPHVDAR